MSDNKIYFSELPATSHTKGMGRIFFALSDDKLLFVDVGGTKNTFTSKLKHKFKHSDIIESKFKLSTVANELMKYFAGTVESFSIPLKLHGTDFQCKVWREMSLIPYGSTITYGELARRVGSPRSARAVGTACSKNPIPIIIPCHRVVSSSGLGGFSLGLNRKKILLDRENCSI